MSEYYFLGSKTPEDFQDTQLNTLLFNYGIGGQFESYWVEGYQYDQEFESNSEAISQDIISKSPKIIIALGSAASLFLLGSKFTSLNRQSGKLLTCKIQGVSYPLIITYSVNYALGDNSTQDLKDRFISDILQAVKYTSGKVSNILDKELSVVLNFKEFGDYIDKELFNKELISYDIETNAQPIHSEWFKTIGFSLSSDPNKGVYVVREALEYKINDDEWKLITNKLLELLKSHRIIVHNSMYEIPAAVNEYGYRIENWEDTLAMARLLLGGKTGAGLKEQCQENLGYPEWEEDLTLYRESMDELRNLFRPTESGSQRVEFTDLEECKGDLITLLDQYESQLNNYKEDLLARVDLPVEDNKRLSQSEYQEEIVKINKRRDSRLIEAIKNIKNLVEEYYEENSSPSSSQIMKLIGLELINLVNSSEYGFLPYSSIPLKILSKYGAMDAVGTFELYDKLSKRIESESTPEVDLWKGYKVVKSQLEVATSMEMAGLHWNDSVAQEEQDWFNEHACNAMREMLLSGFLDEFIFQAGKGWWIDYLIDNNKDELSEQLGFDYILTDLGIKKFEDGQVKGREIRKWRIPELISEEYWESVKPVVIRNAKIRIADPDNFTYFEDFKDFYNPASPGQAKILNPILVNEDIKLAMVLQMVYLILDDAARSPEQEFPSPDNELFIMLRSYRTRNKDIEEWNEDNPEYKKPPITNQEIFKSFKKMIEETKFKSSELNQLIVEGLKYELTSGDEPSMIEIYHLYQLLGFDIEDESTWNDSFRFLYNFRMYKKCIKMITSYITGSKLGRGNVVIVDNETLEAPMPIRVGWYDNKLKDNQSYLMESSFGPCTAETLRWRSGFHTIPSTSSIKNIYTSRYKGGVIFAPDYSQNEVRAIAAVSNCEPMLKAFREGADIHRQNAAAIWKKKPEDVTSVERRYAKMSCLVGSTKIKLLDGTIRTIQELYESGLRSWDTYSFDIDSKSVRMSKSNDIQLTKYVNETVIVEFDNGSSIECTLDHPLLTLNGTYIQAKDSLGSKIETLYTRVPSKGAFGFDPQYRTSNPYEQYRNTRHEYCSGGQNSKMYHIRYGKWEYTHQLYTTQPKINIDHQNFDTLDNRPSNLRILTPGQNFRNSSTRNSEDLYGIQAQGLKFLEYIIENDLEYCKEVYDEYRASQGQIVYFDTLSSYYSEEFLRSILKAKLDYNKSVVDRGLMNNPIEGKSLKEIASVTVVKVTVKNYEQRIPVYDLSVPQYHNYPVYLGSNTSIFVHNTFSLLYGDTPEGFATKFLAGDVSLGRQIFHDFYEAYPTILDWTKARHEEWRRTGKVSLSLTGMFIKVHADDFYGDEMKADRAAQNYPIQSQSSNIAGYVLASVDRYLRSNNMLTRPVLFIHDSLEFDVYPFEFLLLSKKIINIMMDVPNKDFNFLAKVDLEVGVSLGQGLEATDVEMNEEATEGSMIVEGKLSNFEPLLKQWNSIYKEVEYEYLEDPEKIYVPRGDLFVPKLTLSKNFGTYEQLIKAKVHIRY